jgi:hypothetical protein
MSDVAGEERLVIMQCGVCGKSRNGDEPVCGRCHNAHWVAPGPASPDVTPPGPGQPAQREQEAAAAASPSASSQEADPRPATLDTVAAVRVRHLVASFTPKGQPTFHHELAVGDQVILGRCPGQSPLGDLFAGDDSVSRRHAVLEFGSDGIVRLTDEDSTNGTFVNGEKLPPRGEPRVVSSGDRILLGEHTLARIQVRSGPASTSAVLGGKP